MGKAFKLDNEVLASSISSLSSSLSTHAGTAATGSVLGHVKTSTGITNSSGTTKVIKSYDLVTQCPFPVNSIYLSVTSTNPSSLWENTEWEQIAQGRTLIGQGSGTDINGVSKSFSNGSTGGEYTHTLTVQEMPSHSHTYSRGFEGRNYGSDDAAHGVMNDSWNSYETSATGGGQAHNIVQPYLVVYIWKRIS